MNRSDAWQRFAQCRRLQPDALQVLVSADIVDALLRPDPCKKCEGLGGMFIEGVSVVPCPSCGGSGKGVQHEEAA